jgi:hypothetical protein
MLESIAMNPNSKALRKSYIYDYAVMLNCEMDIHIIKDKTNQLRKELVATHLKRMESQIVQDIKFYLNNPNVANWRKLHSLLIPQELKEKESEYWRGMEDSECDLDEIDRIIEELREAEEFDIHESEEYNNSHIIVYQL